MLWFTGLFYFAGNISTSTPETPTQSMDAIVVLTGGRNRIDEGFNLLEKKLAKKLFISGVYRGIDAKQLLNRWKKEPEAEFNRYVVIYSNAINTIQNAKETIKWLKSEKYNSIYLVTSNYHMPRALLEFKVRDENLIIEPYPIISNNINMH